MSDRACHVADVQLGPSERRDFPRDASGRFVYVGRGGIWVASARRAYCLTRGSGIWLPPAAAYRVYAAYEAQWCELRVAPALSAGFVRPGRVERCSSVLASLLSATGRQALARSPQAAVALLFDELRAAGNGAWGLAVDMPSPRSRVANLCDALILNPRRDMRLDEVAGQAGVSIRTLHRIFVGELGTSAGRWRRHAQIGAGMCALALDFPVADIARGLGFTASAFSTFFKAQVGYAPREWLARRRAPAHQDPA
ncbi:helix-turn-helix domain-containing protein [Trinickia mobilis]|uniref:helix-turn-helix domain-containing protein n=1 Tax=Trinickia mobilis TaxID=2816356 RepID=UPI001A8E927D|nr:AraC family transcriptional regulator [Trinickia mobilis]